MSVLESREDFKRLAELLGNPPEISDAAQELNTFPNFNLRNFVYYGLRDQGCTVSEHDGKVTVVTAVGSKWEFTTPVITFLAAEPQHPDRSEEREGDATPSYVNQD